MLRLFFAALVIVILYFMFREYRKLNKKQELREGLNEKLEHVEEFSMVRQKSYCESNAGVVECIHTGFKPLCPLGIGGSSPPASTTSFHTNITGG